MTVHGQSRRLGPLRTSRGTSLFCCLFVALCLQAGAVRAQDRKQGAAVGDPKFELRSKEKKFTPLDALAEFAEQDDGVYRLGEGDEITIDVWDRPELSGKQIVGPDGAVTMPLVGSVGVAGLSRDAAAKKLADALSEYYTNLAVTVRVDRYVSNRVYILGRVSNPGAISFDNPPTLLEAIMRAGGLPIGGVGADKAALTRLAVFRGRDKVVWIELKRLLTDGQLGLNIRLRRNDLIYIPDSDDQLVYVFGEANHPGAYHLTPDMTFMDALAQAGGPTVDGAKDRIYLVRPKDGLSREISMSDIVKAKPGMNISLEEGDVIYVPQRRLSKFSYVLDKVSPLFSTLFIGKGLLPSPSNTSK